MLFEVGLGRVYCCETFLALVAVDVFIVMLSKEVVLVSKTLSGMSKALLGMLFASAFDVTRS